MNEIKKGEKKQLVCWPAAAVKTIQRIPQTQIQTQMQEPEPMTPATVETVVK